MFSASLICPTKVGGIPLLVDYCLVAVLSLLPLGYEYNNKHRERAYLRDEMSTSIGTAETAAAATAALAMATAAARTSNGGDPTATPRTMIQEDAAGEGGEAVATFSNYQAPLWAREVAAAAGETPALSRDKIKQNPNNSDQNIKKDENNKMICIDVDDESEDDEGAKSKNDNNKNNTSSKPKSTKDQVEEAPTNLTMDDAKSPVDQNKAESSQSSQFQSHHHHTSPACESGLLASVSPPTPKSECLTILRQICATPGKLSPLQVEGAGLAIQRHCRLLLGSGGGDATALANGNAASAAHLGVQNGFPQSQPKQVCYRAGFFLGDGAGIGKGRQIAAVIRDSYSRSINVGGVKRRRRHLWLSVSRELVEDAKRDMEDIGCYAPVLDGATVLGGGNNNNNVSDESGVLFVTYALLTSGKGKRMEDIINWLTQGCGGNNKKGQEQQFDGCIIFDEAHKAKNLSMDPPTATGKLVLELQQRLPNGRVMYCSATGVSDLKQMAYATRLGLWGPGTNFNNFTSFRQALEKRGVGAMELLALEMKQAGCFVARTLSWDGAEFNTLKASLSPSQVQVYDESMQWWSLVKEEMHIALARPDMNSPKKMLWSNYWSAHQRFCKELAICAKVPYVVKDALQKLDEGHSIVIGLQTTGEASTQATLEELQSKLSSSSNAVNIDLDEISLPGLLSTAGAVMAGFVRNHFPIAPQPIDPVPVPSMPPQGFSCVDEQQMHFARVRHAERINNMPPPEPIPELVAKRSELLEAITNIELPPAPLDDLIDRLGGVDNVSEMTGRSGRVIRQKKRGSGAQKDCFGFVKRVINGTSARQKFALSAPVSEEDQERLNIVEKKKFMDGRRRVAIISDAASTGISLHAAKKSIACDSRRVHYTIELPWAADKAIQQLGRTHRR